MGKVAQLNNIKTNDADLEGGLISLKKEKHILEAASSREEDGGRGREPNVALERQSLLGPFCLFVCARGCLQGRHQGREREREREMKNK